jgi:hypothetical protein
MERARSNRSFCFSIYGAAVTLDDSCGLDAGIAAFLKLFEVNRNMPDGVRTQGVIRPFDLAEVTHSLSNAGGSQRRGDRLIDIYSSAGRHWILDDRWGVCEIDLLKHRWRSWVISQPMLDAVQLAEAAAIWPMAQLLRLRGIELVPAISIERSGWGALVIAPYPIPREISRIVRAGYRIVGQRWTALIRQDGRVGLWHVPGLTESPAVGGRLIRSKPVWTNPIAGDPWASAEVAWCDAVVAIAAGRRSKSCGRVIAAGEAQGALRRAWPICELPVDRPRLQHPAAALAEQSLCMSVQLSRHEDEFLELIEFARLRTATRTQVTVSKALRRHFTPSARKYRSAALAG